MHGSPPAPNRRSLSVSPAVHAASLEALDSAVPEADAHFRRDHFPPPRLAVDEWRLELRAGSGPAIALTLDELRSYPRHELAVVLECAGHRRAEYRPPTPGVQWSVGGISEAVWAGARLRDLLAEVGTGGGRFVLLEGADGGPFREGPTVPFARALPIEKALHPDTLVAWEMNGRPLPEGHGSPLRAIVPGWYATDSVKWLTRIAVLDAPFDGPFEVDDYRLRDRRGGAGERLTVLPVSSLTTSHRNGARIAPGTHEVRGVAWGGDGGIQRVELSFDRRDWEEAAFFPRAQPYGFTRWSLEWLAEPGLRTIAVRATDASGATQPPHPRWNEGGYANSSIQLVRLLVG